MSTGRETALRTDRADSMKATLGRHLALGAAAGALLGAASAWGNALAPERYLASGLRWLALDALARGLLRGLILGAAVGCLAALPIPWARRARAPAPARIAASLLGVLAALASLAWLRTTDPVLERPSGALPWVLAGLAGASLPLLARRPILARASAAVAGLAVLALGTLAVLRPRHAGPNLLLLSIDTLRADRLGCYGHARARTPHLDALAREGVLWETVIAAAPVTLTSMATFMTGMDPPQHGVHYNGFYQLPRDAVTLSEVLAERGYRTAAAVGNFALDGRFQIGQGFGTYDDRMTQRMNPTPLAEPEGAGAPRNWWEEHRTTQPAQRFANEITDAGLAWLAGQGDEPFFLWLHYMDPHSPYLPPEGFGGRDAYDGEVAFVDAEIGRLLAGYEQRFPGRDTLVVVIGDHGESLGEHGVIGHVFALFEQMLRVPFLMRRIGTLEPGRRVTTPLRGRDVRAEILRALDLSPEAAPADPAPGSEWWAYSETYQPLINETGSPMRSLRSDRWKLVEQEDGLQSLYDLGNDPGEEKNLVHERTDQAARLRAILAELAGPTAAGTLGVDAETLDRLRALGYVE